MENKANNKVGLLKLGYVANLKSCKSELNEMLSDEKQVSTAELNAIVDNAQIVYLNKYGFSKWRNGENVDQKQAAYLYFKTGLQGKTGDSIIGWFERKGKDAIFRGVT